MLRNVRECSKLFSRQDNAGPHTETGYTLWIREQFELLEWKLELQLPQGNPITHTIISKYFIA
jgi:hypothetical protein